MSSKRWIHKSDSKSFTDAKQTKKFKTLEKWLKTTAVNESKLWPNWLKVTVTADLILSERWLITTSNIQKLQALTGIDQKNPKLQEDANPPCRGFKMKYCSKAHQSDVAKPQRDAKKHFKGDSKLPQIGRHYHKNGSKPPQRKSNGAWSHSLTFNIWP